MKLQQLAEAAYQAPPPKKNLPEREIIRNYFVVDEQLAANDEEGVSVAIVPKKGLEISYGYNRPDRRAVIAYCYQREYNEGRWHAWFVDHSTGGLTVTREIDLTKIVVSQLRTLYDGS